MRAGKLTRWQKAGALVPMAVLVGAWGVALANSGLASAVDGQSDSDIPAVPSTAFDDPASVQETPAGIDPRAGTEGTVATLSTDGIPNAALSAYKRAETLLAQADAGCKLPWSVLAAIGRVESNHGRINGNSLDASGAATPGIYGPQLDGSSGFAKISDTDGGALDQDPVYDRAVGPMQFIPGTWKSVGVDADNDGAKNPQDVDDAATSAGIYLCAGPGDLSTPDGLRTAVLRYNQSDSYASTVIAIADAYAQGNYTAAPNTVGSSAPLVHRGSDQSISESDRQAAIAAEQQAKATPTATETSGSTSSSTTPSTTTTPKSTSSSGSTPQPTTAAPTASSSGNVTQLVEDITEGDIPAVTTWAEAKTLCVANGVSALDLIGLSNCISDLLKVG
ncbi:MAG: lytic murein transglycosylase [Aeromicrobium sp.]|uniref:lytic transglycosylase domain-containing protein n=1 Tax=Aeromicrobium sp. TaxID=1871063 RepID=UPI0039E2DF12